MPELSDFYTLANGIERANQIARVCVMHDGVKVGRDDPRLDTHWSLPATATGDTYVFPSEEKARAATAVIFGPVPDSLPFSSGFPWAPNPELRARVNALAERLKQQDIHLGNTPEQGVIDNVPQLSLVGFCAEGIRHEHRADLIVERHGGVVVAVGDPRLDSNWTLADRGKYIVFPDEATAREAQREINMGLTTNVRDDLVTPGGY